MLFGLLVSLFVFVLFVGLLCGVFGLVLGLLVRGLVCCWVLCLVVVLGLVVVLNCDFLDLSVCFEVTLVIGLFSFGLICLLFALDFLFVFWCVLRVVELV